MMYKKEIDGETRRYKLFNVTIIKIINTSYSRRVYLLSLRIYEKIKIEYFVNKIDSINFSFNEVQKSLSVMSYDFKVRIDNINAVSNAHCSAFSEYRGKFCDREVVIVGTGPSLNKYKKIDGAVHIGLNRAYKRSDIDLNFIFIQDINGLRENIEEINAYRRGGCIKFYGANLTHSCSIAESCIFQAGAKRYYTGAMLTDFYPDITSSVFPEQGSVVFPAISFALFTRPKRIYLVGCDASNQGYFDADRQAPFSEYLDMHMNGWNLFKKFQNLYYPGVEIVSINPVGLKGMFRDEYQSS